MLILILANYLIMAVMLLKRKTDYLKTYFSLTLLLTLAWFCYHASDQLMFNW